MARECKLKVRINTPQNGVKVPAASGLLIAGYCCAKTITGLIDNVVDKPGKLVRLTPKDPTGRRSWIMQFDLTGVSEGRHTASVTATAGGGATETATVEFEVVKRTAFTGPKSVVINPPPASDDNITAQRDSFFVTGSVVDAHIVSATMNSVDALFVLESTPGGTFCALFPPLAPGLYALEVSESLGFVDSRTGLVIDAALGVD